MKSAACPYEIAIARAARAGLWNEGLRAHLAHCTSCRETATVTAYLNSGAGVPEQVADLSDARLLWLRQSLMKTEAAAERSLLPIRAAEALVWSAVLGAVVGPPIWMGAGWLAEIKAAANAAWNAWLTATVPAFGGSAATTVMMALTFLFASVIAAMAPDLADD